MEPYYHGIIIICIIENFLIKTLIFTSWKQFSEKLRMNSFVLLEQEFQSFISFTSDDPLSPFTPEMDYEEKLNVTSRALRWSIKLRNRITTLVNAYYLGSLFNQAGSTAQEFKAKNSTTKHYATMAEYTFTIFEENPSQIY